VYVEKATLYRSDPKASIAIAEQAHGSDGLASAWHLKGFNFLADELSDRAHRRDQ
jgi:hypothetical protein